MSNTLHSHQWPEVIDVDGHKVHAPNVLRHGLTTFKGKARELEFMLFKKEIPSGGTVVDVGANIGNYTLVFARAVGPEGRVFAFEPESINLGYSRKNIELNGYRNVEVIPLALGAKKGKLPLFISKNNPGGHQLYDVVAILKEKMRRGMALSEDEQQLLSEHETEMDAPVVVDVVSLDEHFAKSKIPIDLIKIDVEGAEGSVIAGMGGVIKRSPKLKLFFEFWPAGMRAFGTDPKVFLETLADYGFVFFDLENFTRYQDRPEKMGIDDILRRHTHNSSANIFASRG
jgi:FkbM family methyltransferase